VSRILLLAGACWLLFGCSDDEPAAPPPPVPSGETGILAYSWSIQGQKVAADCAAVGAVAFQSIVVDRGYIIDGVRVPCTDFETRLQLYTGAFLSRGSLVETDGFPATGRISEDIFVIEQGKVTTLVIDFPDSAQPMDPASADAGSPELGDDAGTTSDVDIGGDVGSVTPEPDAGTDAGLP
jgi:hypothetical protein